MILSTSFDAVFTVTKGNMPLLSCLLVFLSRLQSEADRLWDVAIQISDDAGHPYRNRAGDMVYPKGIPPQMSNDVIEQVKEYVASGALIPPRTPL